MYFGKREGKEQEIIRIKKAEKKNSYADSHKMAGIWLDRFY
jgi:hypothetical protein